MNCLKILIVLITITNNIFAGNNDSLLHILERTIENKEKFLKVKYNTINQLNAGLREAEAKGNADALFTLYNKLYLEYEPFVYDSAFKYVKKTKLAAIKLNDESKIAYAKIKLSFVLLSSGLFKESLDSLKNIPVNSLPDSIKADYYVVNARIYFDLEDYIKDKQFAPIYRSFGNRFLDSSMIYTNKNSGKYWYCESLKKMKSQDFSGAQSAFNIWISKFKLSDHEYAIAASSLAYVLTLMDKKDEATGFLIKASIADIRSSTKETVALRNLAVQLFNQGDINKASRYIKLALEDATFYNARLRKVEIGAILPIIEGERLATVERQKKQFVVYSVIFAILSVLVIIFASIIFRQLNKIKKVRKILQNTNRYLQQMNDSLSEANKIKEEYIGYFFNINSEYIEKIDAFQKAIHRKIISRQFDDLNNIIKNNDLKKERENLFLNFDRIFLKLFPHFVHEFNALFKDEDKIILKGDELLSPDLRIYALMRLGIKDNEKIAKFLNYSVNTIYTYKTKIKSKSVHREQFEEKIMEIKTY